MQPISRLHAILLGKETLEVGTLRVLHLDTQVRGRFGLVAVVTGPSEA
jgi:hypothetical protein